jgi:hypothetical protein
MSNLRPQQETISFNVDAFEWFPPNMNTKTGPLTKGHNSSHGDSNRLLEDQTTNNYKDIVDEEFQYLF